VEFIKPYHRRNVDCGGGYDEFTACSKGSAEFIKRY
jgi:hypothetical protein